MVYDQSQAQIILMRVAQRLNEAIASLDQMRSGVPVNDNLERRHENVLDALERTSALIKRYVDIECQLNEIVEKHKTESLRDILYKVMKAKGVSNKYEIHQNVRLYCLDIAETKVALNDLERDTRKTINLNEARHSSRYFPFADVMSELNKMRLRGDVIRKLTLKGYTYEYNG